MRKLMIAGCVVSLSVSLSLCAEALGQLQARWAPVGLQGKRVRTVGVSPAWPADPTLIAGSYIDGEVHRSFDGGRTWSTSSPFGTFGISIVQTVFPPTYRTGGPDQTVLMSGSNPLLIHRTMDAGDSWHRPVLPAFGTSMQTWGLVASPDYANDQSIFGASNAGFVRSTDGGATFSTSNAGLPYTNTVRIAISGTYATDQTIFVGHYGSGVGVYRSTNGGDSWEPAGAGLPTSPTFNGPRIYDLAVSPNFGSDQTAFAVVEGHYSIFRTTNGGASWAPALSTDLWWDRIVAFSPNYASDRTVFAATARRDFYISTNGGNTWQQLADAPASPREIKVSPNFAGDKTVFVATRDGLWTVTVPEPHGAIVLLTCAGCAALLRRVRRPANQRRVR